MFGPTATIRPSVGGTVTPVTVTESPSGSIPSTGIWMTATSPAVSRVSTSSGTGAWSGWVFDGGGSIVTSSWPVAVAPLASVAT